MGNKKKGKTQGKGLSVMKTAQAMADRLSTSRHQRRKMAKLAKRHPNEFMQAGKHFEDRDR